MSFDEPRPRVLGSLSSRNDFTALPSANRTSLAVPRAISSSRLRWYFLSSGVRSVMSTTSVSPPGRRAGAEGEGAERAEVEGRAEPSPESLLLVWTTDFCETALARAEETGSEDDGTATVSPHSGHLMRFPAYFSFTLYALPHAHVNLI